MALRPLSGDTTTVRIEVTLVVEFGMEDAMFKHLIVPVDGSPEAWKAVGVAARLASAVAGDVQVVTVVDRLADVPAAERMLHDGLVVLGQLPVPSSFEVLASDTVAQAVADHLETVNGGMVVMSSHGHGRSAAVLGSTVDDLLRRMYGPIVVVGPRIADDAGAADGTYIVPVDGSPEAETIVPIVGAWAIEFGAVPWLVEWVDDAAVPAGVDVFESAYASRLAAKVRREHRHEVQYEVLHGPRASDAILSYADHLGASLLFMTTHGRTGLARLRLGSVAADLIRQSTRPIVVYRPPQLAAG